MKAHLVDVGTKVKVICQGQSQISRSHLKRKLVIAGAFMFHEHILFRLLKIKAFADHTS